MEVAAAAVGDDGLIGWLLLRLRCRVVVAVARSPLARPLHLFAAALLPSKLVTPLATFLSTLQLSSSSFLIRLPLLSPFSFASSLPPPSVATQLLHLSAGGVWDAAGGLFGWCVNGKRLVMRCGSIRRCMVGLFIHVVVGATSRSVYRC